MCSSYNASSPGGRWLFSTIQNLPKCPGSTGGQYWRKGQADEAFGQELPRCPLWNPEAYVFGFSLAGPAVNSALVPVTRLASEALCALVGLSETTSFSFLSIFIRSEAQGQFCLSEAKVFVAAIPAPGLWPHAAQEGWEQEGMVRCLCWL